MLNDLNNESVLLMYLADELPEQDRAEVEQLLASDAGLRSQLNQLAEAHQSFEETMSSLDGGAIAVDSPGMRRLKSAMRRHMLELAAAASPAPAARRRLRYPAWAYPAAAAAMVTIGFLTVWGLRPADPIVIPSGGPSRVSMLPPTSAEVERDKQMAAGIAQSFEDEIPARSDGYSASQAVADEQVAALDPNPSDDASYFGFGDSHE